MDWELIRQCAPFKTVVDIGAHQGEFFRDFSYYFSDCSYLLIEGNPLAEPYLAALGVPYKICLLGDSNREVTYFVQPDNHLGTGNSIYKELTHHFPDDRVIKQTMMLNRFDDLFPNFPIPDFVKLDTQGSELDILKGGENTLLKAQTILLETSVKPYNQGAPLQPDVIKFMIEKEYKLKGIVSGTNRNEETIQQDLLFIKNL